MDNFEYFNVPSEGGVSSSNKGGSNLKRSLSESTRPPLPPKTSNSSLAYANLVTFFISFGGKKAFKYQRI
jgi:hypothetical protein